MIISRLAWRKRPPGRWRRGGGGGGGGEKGSRRAAIAKISLILSPCAVRSNTALTKPAERAHLIPASRCNLCRFEAGARALFFSEDITRSRFSDSSVYLPLLLPCKHSVNCTKLSVFDYTANRKLLLNFYFLPRPRSHSVARFFSGTAAYFSRSSLLLFSNQVFCGCS